MMRGCSTAMTALVGDGARPILPIRRVSARQLAAESIESWAPSRALMSEEVIAMPTETRVDQAFPLSRSYMQYPGDASGKTRIRKGQEVYQRG